MNRNEIFYSKSFDYFLNKIENNNHFRYSRFNDGELNAVIGDAPHKANCDGHMYFSNMGIELSNALLNYMFNENYILESFDYWYDLLPKIKNTLHELKQKNSELKFLNDDFIRISHEREPNTFLKLLDVIKEKNVVIVGPEYLKELNKYFKFRYITVPIKNCYLEKDRIIAEIKSIISKEKNIFFLFSASMAANVIIDCFNDNENTYLDWGSVWDTFFISPKYSFIRKRSTSNLEKYKEIYKNYLI
jgi:hypothetical protein